MDIVRQCDQQAVITIFEMNRITWLLCGIYMSMDHVVRCVLWCEVSTLIDQRIPVVVWSDFNYIIGPYKKKEGQICVV